MLEVAKCPSMKIVNYSGYVETFISVNLIIELTTDDGVRKYYIPDVEELEEGAWVDCLYEVVKWDGTIAYRGKSSLYVKKEDGQIRIEIY